MKKTFEKIPLLHFPLATPPRIHWSALHNTNRKRNFKK